MIHKILVPIDGSEADAKVLEYTITLARAMGASVTLAYTYEPPPPLRRRVLGLLEEFRTSLEEEGKEVIAEVAARLQAEGLTVSGLVVEGQPADAILRAAEAEKPDLLIVASHRSAGLPGMLLGDIADVVRHAPMPVLVVK